MLIWCLLLGSVLSAPADEFMEITNNGVGDILHESDISNIVPSRFITAEQRSRYSTNPNEWSDLVQLNPDNVYFNLFNQHIVNGATEKDLTFCIYDDKMRDAAIALFRLFQNTVGETFVQVREWAKKNVNTEMFMYALRLESLYSSKTDDSTLLPPFIWNPNYFVNTEALAKASLAVNDITIDGMITNQITKVGTNYDTYNLKELIHINSNYSGWNLPKKDKGYLLNYFQEDVALNSYYLGVHLMHPFWMPSEELEFINPKFAEHYYYIHQQLLARYNLEKLHITVQNISLLYDNCEYVPYLRYKNGLSFPTRSCILDNWSDEETYIKSIDIAIKECISRGIIIMQNGETLAMTDDSHINLLAKLIRANLDGIKFAKIVRSVVGSGVNIHPINEYNPAPSMLHHPETSLKDPVYWYMIQYMLKYFTDFKDTMEPFDMRTYETYAFNIVNSEVSKLTTYFDHYNFPVNNALSKEIRDQNDLPAFVSVRQRRLKHADFFFNFTVKSMENTDVVVRLYLGPECQSNTSNCSDQYNNFFELDTFRTTVKKGTNSISWSPTQSKRFSFDDDYNNGAPTSGSSKYSIYRFPENLLIPRGLEKGLNLTLFIMITSYDGIDEFDENEKQSSYYRVFSNELDSKPLGFPFHRQGKGFSSSASNYMFLNISVYHETQFVDPKGYFSPNLY